MMIKLKLKWMLCIMEKKYKLTTEDIKKLRPKIERIFLSGHGKVEILIRNHKIYRTLTTEDELEDK